MTPLPDVLSDTDILNYLEDSCKASLDVIGGRPFDISIGQVTLCMRKDGVSLRTRLAVAIRQDHGRRLQINAAQVASKITR